jgi:hypothetical protein
VDAYAADVTDSRRYRQIFEETKAKVAPIDVLVLNAVYLPVPQPIEEMYIYEFWKGFRINVKVHTALAQVFCQKCSETATRINVSSYLAWLGAIGFAAQGYLASKAAFDLVMQYLAFQRYTPSTAGLVGRPLPVVKPGEHPRDDQVVSVCTIDEYNQYSCICSRRSEHSYARMVCQKYQTQREQEREGPDDTNAPARRCHKIQANYGANDCRHCDTCAHELENKRMPVCGHISDAGMEPHLARTSLSLAGD